MQCNMLTLAQTLHLTLSGPPPLAAGRTLARQLAQASLFPVVQHEDAPDT